MAKKIYPEGGNVIMETKQIAVEDLMVDYTYQRQQRAGFLKREKFDEKMASSITVSRRNDGTYWVLDGGHRTALAKKDGVSRLRAVVISGLSLSDEAKLFYDLNKKTNRPTSLETYRAGLIFSESVKKIDAIVRGVGCIVGDSKRKNETVIPVRLFLCRVPGVGGAGAAVDRRGALDARRRAWRRAAHRSGS
jgi:hypothetical protein